MAWNSIFFLLFLCIIIIIVVGFFFLLFEITKKFVYVIEMGLVMIITRRHFWEVIKITLIQFLLLLWKLIPC